jgi:cation diffusion facilitator CzcD-associated flavoprotein CzcO
MISFDIITLISPIYVDYVIVGAGASGIAAASMLMQYGVDSIVILEAEDRTGGRINTVPFGMLIFHYILCHNHFLTLSLNHRPFIYCCLH